MLATHIGAEETKRAVVHSHTGNQVFSGTRIQIVIPTAQVVFCDSAVINDFRGTGSPRDVILGRSFLRHCKMQIDGPAERYYLEWVA